MGELVPKVSQKYLDKRQREIIYGAIDVISKYGIANASMDRICAGIGLSMGAVYGHFKSKKEIIHAVARSLMVDASVVQLDERRDRVLVMLIAESLIDQDLRVIMQNIPELPNHFLEQYIRQGS